MNRWQIILIIAVASIAWIVYKRVIKKEPLRKNLYSPPIPEVEDWYKETQEKISVLDGQLTAQREAAWEAMDAKERLAFSEDFILNRFGQRAITVYTLKQRLQIGKAHYLTKEDQ